jgi:hypothetical protein
MKIPYKLVVEAIDLVERSAPILNIVWLNLTYNCREVSISLIMHEHPEPICYYHEGKFHLNPGNQNAIK